MGPDTHPPELVVEPLRPEEVATAAGLLARSYADEPLLAYVFARRARRHAERATTPWFRVWARAHVPLGGVLAARVDGRLIGIAISAPPGGVPVGVRRLQFNLGFTAALLRMALTAPRALGLVGFAQRLDRLQPEDSFRHLAWIGVDPEFRKRGVGGALADEIVALADTSSEACWLAAFCPHVHALLEPRGFVVERDVRPFADGPGGWILHRPATRAR